ncbi:tetratricopeptide repeat protein [Pseudoduganella sp. GCM10020061]|uniref:tetratricopeptide repeat protein n=1 Tax=Pseudoduganella sp. GCM10020061 TaxID=3317345 RepID=UPI00363DD325
MQDNSKLSVLVIDPSPGMRGSFQNMLNLLNISKIEYAVSAGTAVRAVMKKQFDIVLCEYDLGSGQEDGQDGQQLLEDLRHHRLIGMLTIFIMITSEGVYSKVVSAAELTPTDYILKPFTVDMLSGRIARALERRAAFVPTYLQIGQGDLRAAIRSCADASARGTRYAVDFMRLRAELHLNLGEVQQAEELYRAILQSKSIGWAELGLARALAGQERLDEAVEMLNALISSNPRFMAAYDLLAQCHEQAGRNGDAKRVLEEAVAVSPHMVRRLRHLGHVALDSGDVAAAEKSYKQVVARSRYSEFRDPEDHVNLARTLLRKGDQPAAAAVVRDIEKSMRGNPKAEACMAVSSAMIHDAAGEQEAAEAALNAAVEAVRAAPGLSAQLKLGLARSCLAHQLDNQATQVMLDALADPDSGVTVGQATGVFVKAGRPDLADTMGSKMKRQVATLMNVATEKSAMGDLKGAVHTLSEALRMAPGNLPVMLALSKAILRQVDELGWDHPLAELCSQQLSNIRQLDPSHAQLAELTDAFHSAKRRYGISG